MCTKKLFALRANCPITKSCAFSGATNNTDMLRHDDANAMLQLIALSGF